MKKNKSVELKSGRLKSKVFVVTRELHPPPIHIPDMPFNLTPILTLKDLFWQNGIYTFTLRSMGYEMHNLKVIADNLNGLNRRIGEAIGIAVSQTSSQFYSEVIKHIRSQRDITSF